MNEKLLAWARTPGYFEPFPQQPAIVPRRNEFMKYNEIEDLKAKHPGKDVIGVTATLSHHIRVLASKHPSDAHKIGETFAIMIQDAMRFYRKIPQGPQRAVAAIGEVQCLLEKFKKESPHKISCKKGCAHCCRIEVAISQSEADLIYNFSKDVVSLEHRKEKLLLQKDLKQDDFVLKLSYQDASCVFLNDIGACSIYKYRPLMCRKYLVITPPEMCSTENKILNDVASTICPEVEVIVSAMFSLECETIGNIATKMLQKMEADNGR